MTKGVKEVELEDKVKEGEKVDAAEAKQEAAALNASLRWSQQSSAREQLETN